MAPGLYRDNPANRCRPPALFRHCSTSHTPTWAPQNLFTGGQKLLLQCWIVMVGTVAMWLHQPTLTEGAFLSSCAEENWKLQLLLYFCIHHSFHHDNKTYSNSILSGKIFFTPLTQLQLFLLGTVASFVSAHLHLRLGATTLVQGPIIPWCKLSSASSILHSSYHLLFSF